MVADARSLSLSSAVARVDGDVDWHGGGNRSLALGGVYASEWSWLPAGILFVTGIFIYRQAGMHFSCSQLGGLPEILPENHDQRLVTTGIRARLRHPIYLGHLCEMLAWSVGTGLAVCWVLTAFAIVTGATMIRLEDAELEARFGEEYRRYQFAVPAVLPKGNVS
jgi:protein-S-isoprenylcysteine O-methyltransferase Ste14